MQEFKVKYDHAKAKEVLGKLHAVFAKDVLLEDIYLIDNRTDTYKLSRTEGGLSLVHLINKGDRFDVVFDSPIEEKLKQGINNFFAEDRADVVCKNRNYYTVSQSTIVLDNVTGLGEYLELYPSDDRARESLFEGFGLTPADVITESYRSLLFKVVKEKAELAGA